MMKYSLLAAFALAFLAYVSCDDDMEKLCAKATDETKAAAVLKCFKMDPESEDMKSWLYCKKELGSADISCPKFLMKLCEDEKMSNKFDECAEKRFRKLTEEEIKTISECVQKI